MDPVTIILVLGMISLATIVVASHIGQKWQGEIQTQEIKGVVDQLRQKQDELHKVPYAVPYMIWTEMPDDQDLLNSMREVIRLENAAYELLLESLQTPETIYAWRVFRADAEEAHYELLRRMKYLEGQIKKT